MEARMRKVITVVLLVLATQVQAYDGQTTGPVSQIEVNAQSDEIRVYQSGVKVMCNKGPEYAVITENDKNFKTTISLLMMSRTIGESMVISTLNVGGVCRIAYVKMGHSAGVVN